MGEKARVGRVLGLIYGGCMLAFSIVAVYLFVREYETFPLTEFIKYKFGLMVFIGVFVVFALSLFVTVVLAWLTKSDGEPYE